MIFKYSAKYSLYQLSKDIFIYKVFCIFFILVNYSTSFTQYISFSQKSLAFKYLHKHRMLNVELKKEIKIKCNSSQLHH